MVNLKSRAARNIAWIERYCRVPEGAHVGKPVKLRDWQRGELRDIYDNPAAPAARSCRSGARTERPRSPPFYYSCICAARNTGRIAAILDRAKPRASGADLLNWPPRSCACRQDLPTVVKIREAAKESALSRSRHPLSGAFGGSLTAYGLSPVFTVHDELGQVKGPRSELYEALETATGANEAPLTVIISTQAPTDGDLLSMLIDDALAGHDPRTVCRLYTAPKELNPFEIETIELANPALGTFLNASKSWKWRRTPSACPRARRNSEI